MEETLLCACVFEGVRDGCVKRWEQVVTQNLAERMICSQQWGKETLGPLISKFESPKCSRRLGFMNNKQMHVEEVDL